MSAKMKHILCGQVQGPISSKYLLSLLFDLSDDKGEFIMSAKNMHRITRFSTSTVLRAMHKLQNQGHLKIIHRANEDGGQASNKYVLIPRGGN